jgi:hypothetical protein
MEAAQAHPHREFALLSIGVGSTSRPTHSPVAQGHQGLRRERIAMELDLLRQGLAPLGYPA